MILKSYEEFKRAWAEMMRDEGYEVHPDDFEQLLAEAIAEMRQMRREMGFPTLAEASDEEVLRLILLAGRQRPR